MKRTTFATVCLLVAAWDSGAWGKEAAEYSLLFGRIAIPAGQRIVGFDIRMRSACFSSMRVIPPGWRIELDNDASWSTEASGSISVGAAAIDIASLNKLLRIRPESRLGDVVISGEIITTADFETEHHVALKSSDVHMEALIDKP